MIKYTLSEMVQPYHTGVSSFPPVLMGSFAIVFNIGVKKFFGLIWSINNLISKLQKLP